MKRPFAGLLLALALPVGATCPELLDHRTASLQGEAQDLCRHAGQVVLVVNTASYCGYTNQYEGLEKLYQRFRGKGFVVLGFPSNDFGQQEPGSNKDVADFCERTFKVRFPMHEKTAVSGAQASPLFRQLAARAGGAPKWNFHKYLVGRNGEVVGSFPSKVAPDDPKLLAALEGALAARR